MASIDEVHEFWFGRPATTHEELAIKMRRWYLGGTSEDALIRTRFGADVERALGGALDEWAGTPRGRLTLILLLDQMTRSVFRDQARAFAGDPKAQRLAVEALDSGLSARMSFEERQFLLMPLLHAEDVGLLRRFGVEVRRHVEAAPEFARAILASGLEQAAKYLEVVTRFGRFPHRNEAMGRVSTPEEVEFLKDWAARAAPAVARELAKQP